MALVAVAIVNIPLSRFEGFLKQVRRADLSEEAKIALDVAFPGFWPADPTSDYFKSGQRRLEEQGVDYVFNDVDPPRRLAGCWSLPRGRYFSLCLDRDGNDINTLVNELNGYLDPMRGGLCIFGDMVLPQIAEEFESNYGISRPAGPYLLFIFVGRPGAISPVISAFEKTGLDTSIHDQQKSYVLVSVDVPYFVDHFEIDGVFDLRTSPCQDYLVAEFFQKDTETLTKMDRSGVSRFVETLPLLMHPSRGGGPHAQGEGALLQGLAAFLRSQGTQALVFPSARSDVMAEQKHSALTAWRGWCLVDYRGAPDPIMTKYVDLSTGWPATFPKGATIRVAHDGEFSGSFEVTGVVKWGRDRVGELEARFVGKSTS